MRKADNRKMIRTGRTAAVTMLILGVVTQAVFPAFAEENIIGPSGRGYSESRWEKLTDNVLEYDELEDRIHEFNSTFNSTWETLRQTKEDLQGYVLDLESSKFKLENLESSAKESLKKGDSNVSQEDWGNYNAALNGMKMGKVALPSFGSLIANFQTNAEKTLEDMIPLRQRKQMKNGERQILQGAQQLMIAYSALMKQKRTLEAMASMYEEQYRIVLDKQAQGMATEKEVLEAQANQLNAASLAASLEGGMLQMKPRLCTLAGFPADADPVVSEIPPVDLTEIDQLDPDGEDLRKAIGSNQTLISQRTSKKGNTMAGVEARLEYITEGEEKLKIKMRSLYDDILECRTAYEGAVAGLEAAKRDREKYRRMKELGYLSKADFLGTEIAYYSEESEFYSADTALRLALAAYNWAIMGLTPIE